MGEQRAPNVSTMLRTRGATVQLHQDSKGVIVVTRTTAGQGVEKGILFIFRDWVTGKHQIADLLLLCFQLSPTKGLTEFQDGL